MAGKLNILERQADDTLVLTDVIPTGEEKYGCMLVIICIIYPQPISLITFPWTMTE
jgi:hypothetical protein